MLPHNHCYGCGPQNPHGLRLKSYWSGDRLSVARFTPEPYHCAGPKHFVNGGVIATVIDCHAVCSAAAAAYLDEDREIGSKPDYYYATTKLELEYLRPTPIDSELIVEARVGNRSDRSYVLSCELRAGDKVCVAGQVEAISVPESWILGKR